MPTTSIHLPDDIHRDVQRYAHENCKNNFSAACRILMETGLKVKVLKNKNVSAKQQKKAELAEKQTLYLLQNLNITKEILRCVFNSKYVLTGGSTAEENLKMIPAGTQHYIDGFIGKDQ